MLFLHESLNNERFKFDKKLNLLKKGVITITQFINLIEHRDPYILIGPAVVDKTKIKDFLSEWENNVSSNLTKISNESVGIVTQADVINKLDDIVKIFPEVEILAKEFKERLKVTDCPKCTKNQYIYSIISIIRPLYGDGRSLGDLKEFIENMIMKYFPIPGKIATSANFSTFDTDWIKPDTIVGLGNDLIKGLDNCFDCTKKHIGRAKAFYEEFKLGYPQHEPLMFNELIDANKALEEAFTYYSDSLAQLDMASCELVGEMTDLEDGWQVQMIELADLIRQQRILFQEDPTKVPEWDRLRIEVQRLQNKINKLKKEEKKNKEVENNDEENNN